MRSNRTPEAVVGSGAFSDSSGSRAGNRWVAGADTWPFGGQPVSLWVGGLPDFDEVTVWISDAATRLVLMLLRPSQELSSPGTPSGVRGLDVRDPDVEEAADTVRIAWRLKGDRGLVVSRTPAGVNDDETVGESERSPAEWVHRGKVNQRSPRFDPSLPAIPWRR